MGVRWALIPTKYLEIKAVNLSNFSLVMSLVLSAILYSNPRPQDKGLGSFVCYIHCFAHSSLQVPLGVPCVAYELEKHWIPSYLCFSSSCAAHSCHASPSVFWFSCQVRFSPSFGQLLRTRLGSWATASTAHGKPFVKVPHVCLSLNIRVPIGRYLINVGWISKWKFKTALFMGQ